MPKKSPKKRIQNSEPGQRVRKGISKEVIISTAKEIANRDGLHYFNMSDVAKKLKVKPPSLHKHVAGIDEIKDELTRLAYQTLTQNILLATSGVNGRDSLFELAHTMRKLGVTDPCLHECMLGSHVNTSVQTKRAGEQMLTIAANLFDKAVSDTDKIHAMRGFRSMVHGFILLEQNHGFGLDVNVDQSFRWMIERWLNSIELKNES